MAKQTTIASFFTKSPGPGKTKEQESPRGSLKLRGNDLQRLDLVWAKLEGHPWWPALVCNSPGEKTFVRRNQIHVQFFDKPPTRGWVKDGLVKPYGPAMECGVPSYRDAAWLEAVREAGEAEQLPREDRSLLLVDMLPSDDDDDLMEAMEEIENDSDKSKENMDISGVNGRAGGDKPSKGEPKAKRRRIILHSDSESEDDYKPDESGDSDDDSDSSGVDEAQVSGPETESEIDSPVKVPGAPPGAPPGANTTGGTSAVAGEAGQIPDPGGTVQSGPRLASQRDNMRMERMLEAWVLDCMRRGHPPSRDTLEKKVKELFQEGIATRSEWLECLAQRCCLDGPTDQDQGQDQAVNQDTLRQKVQDLVQKGNYSPKQVFVVGETGLWWGCLPGKKAKAGHRLTLLLCFNADGDCRLRPLVVGHQSRPAALKDTRMSSLPVVWRSNRRARVTSVMFDDWFVNHFVPAVQEHCHSNGLPERGLLLVSNTPGRPSHLLDHPTVKMAYLPPNGPWPVGRGVADALGRHYLRLGVECVARNKTGNSLWDLWKEVDLKMALRNIYISWNLLTQETLNKTWSGMWPGAVHPSRATAEAPTQEIVALVEGCSLRSVSETVVEAVVCASQEEPREEALRNVAKTATSLEDEGLEEPVPGLLALTPWDLRDILHHLEDACTLVEGVEGSKELCRQLKEASKEYNDLLAASEGGTGTDFPTLCPIKKEEVEIGEEHFVIEES